MTGIEKRCNKPKLRPILVPLVSNNKALNCSPTSICKIDLRLENASVKWNGVQYFWPRLNVAITAAQTAVMKTGTPHPRMAYIVWGKRPWNTVTVTTLCRYSPSINIHMNIAVRAYSKSTYEHSHRNGCKRFNVYKTSKVFCQALMFTVLSMPCRLLLLTSCSLPMIAWSRYSVKRMTTCITIATKRFLWMRVRLLRKLL